jgi:hypothetical protein
MEGLATVMMKFLIGCVVGAWGFMFMVILLGGPCYQRQVPLSAVGRFVDWLGKLTC